MKIRENGQPIAGVHSKKPTDKKQEEAVQNLKPSKDTLKISGKAKEIEQIIAKVPKESVNVEKVQEIKRKIEEGTYLIRPEQIAEKMLSDE